MFVIVKMNFEEKENVVLIILMLLYIVGIIFVFSFMVVCVKNEWNKDCIVG